MASGPIDETIPTEPEAPVAVPLDVDLAAIQEAAAKAGAIDAELEKMKTAVAQIQATIDALEAEKAGHQKIADDAMARIKKENVK